MAQLIIAPRAESKSLFVLKTLLQNLSVSDKPEETVRLFSSTHNSTIQAFLFHFEKYKAEEPFTWYSINSHNRKNLCGNSCCFEEELLMKHNTRTQTIRIVERRDNHTKNTILVDEVAYLNSELAEKVIRDLLG